MLEIRVHGRGGQGVVAASEILAISFFNNGKKAQSFPHFGVERSGAPIQAFVRVSDKEILTRERVYKPDVLVVLDDSLLDKEGILDGLKDDGDLFINSKKSASEIYEYLISEKLISKNFKEANIYTVDASKVALAVFKKNIVNTAMLGSLAKKPNFISLDSIVKAISHKFKSKGKDLVDKNIKAINMVYNSL